MIILLIILLLVIIGVARYNHILKFRLANRQHVIESIKAEVHELKEKINEIEQEKRFILTILTKENRDRFNNINTTKPK